MPAQFECYKVQPGEFRFRLIGGNGDVILSSEAYKTKLGCTKGIQSVIANSPNPDNYVQESSPNGSHRFIIISLNGRVLGFSQDYQTMAEYNAGLSTVARTARDAEVDIQC